MDLNWIGNDDTWVKCDPFRSRPLLHFPHCAINHGPPIQARQKTIQSLFNQTVYVALTHSDFNGSADVSISYCLSFTQKTVWYIGYYNLCENP